MAAGQDSVLGEDISVLIITFTSDWLTVPQIKKVHLASINYIYLRLSLHEISALAKKISVIKSRTCRMNTFSDKVTSLKDEKLNQ